MPSSRILLGVIGRPHGVRGLVRVHSYTEDPAALAAYGPLTDEKGRRWTIAWHGEGVAELHDEGGQGLPDRAAAEKLTNTRLYVDRDSLPPADVEEWYLADLVGLKVLSGVGEELGRVVAVHDYGAGVSLEIAGDGPTRLVPFTRAAVPVVDIPAGRLTVEPPAEIAGEPGR